MLTYEDAKRLMKGARNGRRKLGNNTYLEERSATDILTQRGCRNHSKDCPCHDCVEVTGPYTGPGYRKTWQGKPSYAVRLHHTDVVTLHPDGSQTLDSGGWRTVTTKDRINAYAPVRVFSDRGSWFVVPTFPGAGPIDWERRYAFADGMRVYPDGKVEGAGIDETAIRKRVLRMIGEYIKGYADSVRNVGLTPPSNGDCWGCYMKTASADGKALPPGKGDITGVDHYLSHFEEKYYVPSLYWRAIQPRGILANPHYNPNAVWAIADAEAKRGRTDMIERDLRRYFRELTPALVETLQAR